MSSFTSSNGQYTIKNARDIHTQNSGIIAYDNSVNLLNINNYNVRTNDSNYNERYDNISNTYYSYTIPNSYVSVTYGLVNGRGLFVALAASGTLNRISTSENGIDWTVQTTPFDNTWKGIAYGNGVFVAVGDGTGSKVMRSVDGINWTLISSAITNGNYTWKDIAYGSGLFVAVASLGTYAIMTSPDGTTWSVFTGAGNVNSYGITKITFGLVNGLGTFIAYGYTSKNVNGEKTMLRSTNGNVWTTTSVHAIISQLRYHITGIKWGLINGSGLFIAVGINTAITSPNGINWTAINIGSANWSSIAYGSGVNMFVAVSSSGTENSIITTTDGSTWRQGTSPSNSSWSSITYGIVNNIGTFVAVANQTTNNVMTSSDGLLKNVAGSMPYNYSIERLTWGNGLFVGVGGDATIQNNVMISADGINWSFKKGIPGSNSDVKYGSGVFVAVGTRIMTSADGENWTERTNPKPDYNYTGLAYGEIQGSGLFVAIGRGFGVITSNDGITWTSRTVENINSNAVYLCYGKDANNNGLFVAVTNSSGTITISSDGITWNVVSTIAGRQYSSVTWGIVNGSGLFVAIVAVSSSSTSTSSNGTNWTISSGMPATNGNSPISIIWGYNSNGTGVFIVAHTSNTELYYSTNGITYGGINLTKGRCVGYGYVNGNPLFIYPSNSQTIQYSSLGTSGWSSKTLPQQISTTSVVYGTVNSSGLFVAVGNTGTGARVNISYDGMFWNNALTPADNSWSSVCYGNNRFVAVAQSGTGSRAMYSTNGVNWTLSATPLDISWNSVAYGLVNTSPLFVAVGSNNSIMTSANGTTWSLKSVNASNDTNWSGITYGKVKNFGLFVSVASIGSGTQLVMTSSNGNDWNVQNASSTNAWISVTYGFVNGNGLFVAIANSGSNRVMISLDGIIWSSIVLSSVFEINWQCITWGTVKGIGHFVAVASAAQLNTMMTSVDGVNWTLRNTSAMTDFTLITWKSVTFGNVNNTDVLVTVSNSSSGLDKNIMYSTVLPSYEPNNSLSIGSYSSNSGYKNAAAIGNSSTNNSNNQIVLGTENTSVYIPNRLTSRNISFLNNSSWSDSMNYTDYYFFLNGFTLAYGYCISAAEPTTITFNSNKGFTHIFTSFVTKYLGVSSVAPQIISFGRASITIDPDYDVTPKSAFFWAVIGCVGNN